MATILYVDDHPPARLLMQAVIAELTTHELIVAGDGAAAEQLARTHKPALYILDLDLPDIDGLKLSQRLHDISPAPVLLVSAYAEAIDADNLPPIISQYLSKPLDPSDVAATVNRTLA